MTNQDHIDPEAFKAEFAKIAEKTFHLRLNGLEAWILLSHLQLSLRHPRGQAVATRLARSIAQRLELQIAQTPALAHAAAAGWRLVPELGPDSLVLDGHQSPKVPDPSANPDQGGHPCPQNER